MSTRMYRDLAGIVAGWTKNLATGVPLAFPPSRLVRRVVPYVMWLPALAWILPPLLWALFGWQWAAATTAISLAIWLVVYRIAEAPLRYVLLYPLGAAMVAYIMICSAWRGGHIEWRGRRYSVVREAGRAPHASKTGGGVPRCSRVGRISWSTGARSPRRASAREMSCGGFPHAAQRAS